MWKHHFPSILKVKKKTTTKKQKEIQWKYKLTYIYQTMS